MLTRTVGMEIWRQLCESSEQRLKCALFLRLYVNAWHHITKKDQTIFWVGRSSRRLRCLILDAAPQTNNNVHTHSFHIQLASNSPIVYIYFIFYLNIRSEKQIVDIFFPLHFDSDCECWFVDVDLAIEIRFITYTRDIYRGFALYKNAHAYVSSLSLCAIKRQPKVFIFMRLNLNTKTQK